MPRAAGQAPEGRPVKPDVVQLKEVASPSGVILQKGPPSLAVVWSPTSGLPHILLDGPLRDLDSKLQKLASDAFRSPKAILSGHALDELDGLLGQR